MPSLQELVVNPWFQLASFAIGVLGIAIAILTAMMARKFKKLSHTRRSFNLVRRNRSTVTSLTVTFSGRPIEALTITKLLIWNSGNEAIRESDFPPKEKLRITTSEDVELLESEILQVSSCACGCVLGPLAPHGQTVSFDFLDPNDGVVLQVAHTGSSGRALSIQGQIVGKGRISEKGDGMLHVVISAPIPRLKTRSRKLSLGLVFLALGTFMLIWSGKGLLSKAPAGKLEWPFAIIIGVGGASYAWFGISAMRQRVPKGLEKFEDRFGKEESSPIASKPDGTAGAA